MNKVERLEAELELEKAAEAFRDAKAANDGSEKAEAKYREAKSALSALRSAYRRDYRPTDTDRPEDALTAPDPVKVAVAANSVGGAS